MNTKDFLDSYNKLVEEAKSELEKVTSQNELKELSIKYLGRKSELVSMVRSIKDLPKEDRGEAGKTLNVGKKTLEESFAKTEKNLKESEDEIYLDVTAPGTKPKAGHLHITTQAIKEIEKIFSDMGFYRVRYPEVEWDYYAFTALNFPEDHPARDDWETFFIDEANVDDKLGRRLLTPHTSSGQIREMERRKPPIRMMNISRVYRREFDVSHELNLFQFEGMMVDKGVNIKHLKGVIQNFVDKFFGEGTEVRIRPYDFKFTEPSFEVDIKLYDGHPLSKKGWLEIGGAGMVHPNVLRAGGIDPDVYTGFAFGFGVERNKMVQGDTNIPDIRLVYSGDIRFLDQF